jgi:hypothetical protein
MCECDKNAFLHSQIHTFSNWVYCASANIFSPLATACSIVPTKLKAASGNDHTLHP